MYVETVDLGVNLVANVQSTLPRTLRTDIEQWFGQRAAAVDHMELSAQDGLVYLAEQNLLAKGISPQLGGDGDGLDVMIEIVATVARQCLTSAFVLWSHRSVIGLVAKSDNEKLREKTLPALLQVQQLGATGLANALKYAASLEELTIHAHSVSDDVFSVSGTVPWASNLVARRFVLAVAARLTGGKVLLCILPSTADGITTKQTSSLLAMDGSISGSVTLTSVPVAHDDIVSRDGLAFLAEMRPTFLLLQCGLPIGVAQGALHSIATLAKGPKATLTSTSSTLQQRLDELITDVIRLSRKTDFTARDLYDVIKTRKELTELALQAVWVELEAAGGAGYVASSPTARRLREAAFLPLQTPSLLQLRLQLQRLQADLQRPPPVSAN